MFIKITKRIWIHPYYKEIEFFVTFYLANDMIIFLYSFFFITIFLHLPININSPSHSSFTLPLFLTLSLLIPISYSFSIPFSLCILGYIWQGLPVMIPLADMKSNLKSPKKISVILFLLNNLFHAFYISIKYI